MMERRIADNIWLTGSRNKISGNQTPRAKQKPFVPLPARKSVTPSRVNERVASSPLKLPLERAIDNCCRREQVGRQLHSRELSSREVSSRRLGVSSRREGDSSASIIRRGIFEQQEIESNKRVHVETVNFLKKYFDLENGIDVGVFVERLLMQYEDLWGDQNVEGIVDNFRDRVYQLFGDEVDPRSLLVATRQDGMIGLILQIFRSINEGRSSSGSFLKSANVMHLNKSFEEQLNEGHSIQEVKNIIQEFMELMYKEMETQIYGKFNVEMRRMILKYRQAERIVKKVQEKLVHHADFFQVQQKWKKRVKTCQDNLEENMKKLEKIQDELKREKQINTELKVSKAKMEEENMKLRQNLQKFQNILISKFELLPSETSIGGSSIPSLSRKITSNGLTDRTQQFNNVIPQNHFVKQQQPFQIKIDTHFIQRQNAPPMTQTTTTFMDPIANFGGNNNNGYSPIKLNAEMIDSHRPSYEGIRPGTKIGQYTYSPYQSRINRPF